MNQKSLFNIVILLGFFFFVHFANAGRGRFDWSSYTAHPINFRLTGASPAHPEKCQYFGVGYGYKEQADGSLSVSVVNLQVLAYDDCQPAFRTYSYAPVGTALWPQKDGQSITLGKPGSMLTVTNKRGWLILKQVVGKTEFVYEQERAIAYSGGKALYTTLQELKPKARSGRGILSCVQPAEDEENVQCSLEVDGKQATCKDAKAVANELRTALDIRDSEDLDYKGEIEINDIVRFTRSGYLVRLFK